MPSQAKMLMLASGNLLKPSDGAPVTVPTQDMILGSYYLTTVRENDEGAGKVFRDENEALMAYAEHIVTLHAPIKVRRTMTIDGVERTGLVEATVGRIIFNNPVPQNLGYIDRTDPEHWLEYEVSFRVTKKTLPALRELYRRERSRVPVEMKIEIEEGGEKLTVTDGTNKAFAYGDAEPQPARTDPTESLSRSLSKTGGTPFSAEKIDVEMDGGPWFVPGSAINELRREVLVEDQPVDLTPKEYELLIYFKNNRSIALSRESILNAVWGYDYFGDLRTVDTHVKKLRAKLGDCGSMIETVRGYGYRFEG